ncbi:hypothetical protein BT69DRAFT_846843 [Atractiella rhizophila]|nr:hypothetical protein BT69DRAFT_846843 [Atractiella rhizophila]
MNADADADERKATKDGSINYSLLIKRLKSSRSPASSTPSSPTKTSKFIPSAPPESSKETYSTEKEPKSAPRKKKESTKSRPSLESSSLARANSKHSTYTSDAHFTDAPEGESEAGHAVPGEERKKEEEKESGGLKRPSFPLTRRGSKFNEEFKSAPPSPTKSADAGKEKENGVERKKSVRLPADEKSLKSTKSVKSVKSAKDENRPVKRTTTKLVKRRSTPSMAADPRKEEKIEVKRLAYSQSIKAKDTIESPAGLGRTRSVDSSKREKKDDLDEGFIDFSKSIKRDTSRSTREKRESVKEKEKEQKRKPSLKGKERAIEYDVEEVQIENRPPSRSSQRLFLRPKTPDENETSEEDEPPPRSRPPSIASSRRSGVSKKSTRKSVRIEESSAGEEVVEKEKERKGGLTLMQRHYLNKSLVYMEMQREWNTLSKVGALTKYGPPFLPTPAIHKTTTKARMSRIQSATSSDSEGKQSRRQSTWFGTFKNRSSSTGIGGAANEPEHPELMQVEVDAEVEESPMLKYLYWRFVNNFPGLKEAKLAYWQKNIQPFFDSIAARELSESGGERAEITKRKLLATGITRILGTYFSTCVTSAGDSTPARPDKKITKRLDDVFPGDMDAMCIEIVGSSKKQSGQARYNAWVAVVDSRDSKGQFIVLTRVLTGTSKPYYLTHRTRAEFEAFDGDLKEIKLPSSFDFPILSSGASLHILQRWLRHVVIALSNPNPEVKRTPALTKARQLMEAFLLDGGRQLNNRERDSLVNKAKAADEKAMRDRKIWLKLGTRARKLRTTWHAYKAALIDGNEIDRSFAQLKKHERYENLPETYRITQEWARIWVAYMLHFVFAAAPNARDITLLVQAIHNHMPYGLMKQGLKMINPTFMIKFLVNLFCAHPPGALSLIQRILCMPLNNEIKSLKREIRELEAEVKDEQIVKILADHAAASREEQSRIHSMADATDQDLIVTLLKEKKLHAAKLGEVKVWEKAYNPRSHTEADDDDFEKSAINQEDASRYVRLKQLLRAYTLKRDREKFVDLIHENNTPVLLKSTISVFYSAIYKLANASDLASRLGELQAFLTDLINVSLSKNNSPADYISLAKRHDQALWMILHEAHAFGGDLTIPIYEWCKSGLSFISEGIPSSSEEKGRLAVDFEALLGNVDPETRRDILEEMDDLIFYTKYYKAAADLRLRIDLLRIDHPEWDISYSSTLKDVLERDPETQSYLDRVGGEEVTDLSWAWWSENLHEGVVDWKKVEEQNALKTTSKKTKLEKRSSSVKSVPKAANVKKEDVAFSALPPPKLVKTRQLLDGYVDAIKDGLDLAKEKAIK